MNSLRPKTLRGTLLASPDCVACYVACLLLFCCFLGCLLRWLLCYCFLGCHCFYSPFVESTSNLQRYFAVNECIESQKNSVKKKIAFYENQFADRNRYSQPSTFPGAHFPERWTP